MWQCWASVCVRNQLLTQNWCYRVSCRVRNDVSSSCVNDVSSEHDIMSELTCVSCVEAVDRGVVFELCYSAAIRDSTMRRYTITNALSLMESCKGKVRSFLSPQAPTAVTSLWGHRFNFQYKSSINSDCLSFRTWSCPVQLRRSVISWMVISISIDHWYRSVLISDIDQGRCVPLTLVFVFRLWSSGVRTMSPTCILLITDRT